MNMNMYICMYIYIHIYNYITIYNEFCASQTKNKVRIAYSALFDNHNFFVSISGRHRVLSRSAHSAKLEDSILNENE